MALVLSLALGAKEPNSVVERMDMTLHGLDVAIAALDD